MKRFVLSCLALISALTLLAGDAEARKKGQVREEPVVSSGITVSSNLASGIGANNIDGSTSLTNAFSTTFNSATVTVSWTAHGMTTGNRVTFYNSTAVGGLSMDGGWVIASASTNSFTFTHTNLATSTAGPTGTTIAENAQTDADGKIRFLCSFSHLSYDDPILFPNRPGATHLHLFFGNRNTNYASTYATLRASGAGTCDGGPINRTAYWMPAMIDTSLNQVRIPIDFQWYYAVDRANLIVRRSSLCDGPPVGRVLQDGRAIACPQYPIKRLERGNAAVFGFQTSTGNYPSTYLCSGPTPCTYGNILEHSYTCQTNAGGIATGNSFRYLYHRTTPGLGLASDSGCPTNGIVSLRTGNPGCWNGSHSGDFTNFAPHGDSGVDGTYCPATHPYAFMAFTVISTWHYTGGIATLSNWQLSSDRFNGANFEAGESFHWDMLWAWEDAVQEHFHKNIHGMAPNQYSDSPAPPAYLYSRIGSATDAERWVGGPFLRNTNNGGLSGNAGMGDCTPLGFAGMCALAPHTGGGSDINVAIPTAPLGTYTLPYLLKRDIEPASNDNSPMWLEKAA